MRSVPHSLSEKFLKGWTPNRNSTPESSSSQKALDLLLAREGQLCCCPHFNCQTSPPWFGRGRTQNSTLPLPCSNGRPLCCPVKPWKGQTRQRKIRALKHEVRRVSPLELCLRRARGRGVVTTREAVSPDEIIDALRWGSLTALSSPDGRVKGIVVGDILRRMVHAQSRTRSRQVETTVLPPRSSQQ